MTHEIASSDDVPQGEPADVIAVIVETHRFHEFQAFPGAIDVVVVSEAAPTRDGRAVEQVDEIGSAWVLVSPAGHRVAAICVRTDRVPVEGGRVERHFAVGARDRALVEPGAGWSVEGAWPCADGVDALLLHCEPPVNRRHGVVLTFAVEQLWAGELRGATHVQFVDLPDEPRAVVLRHVEDHTAGPAHTVIEVELEHDPWLGVGAVYRLRPRTAPVLRLLPDL